MAARHFGGTLDGRRVLTAGLGGMGGAQGLASRQPRRPRADRRGRPRASGRRAEAGWVDLVTDDYREALSPSSTTRRRPRDRASSRTSPRSLPGWSRRRRVRRRHRPDRRPRPAARLRPGGLHRRGRAAGAAARTASYLRLRSAARWPRTCEASARRSAHRGAVVFEYGNSLRAQARYAGGSGRARSPGSSPPTSGRCSPGDRPVPVDRADGRPGGPAPDRGCADGRDRHRRWPRGSRSRAGGCRHQGLPARICWLGLGERDAVGLRLNELVAHGRDRPARARARPHGSGVGRRRRHARPRRCATGATR